MSSSMSTLQAPLTQRAKRPSSVFSDFSDHSSLTTSASFVTVSSKPSRATTCKTSSIFTRASTSASSFLRKTTRFSTGSSKKTSSSASSSNCTQASENDTFGDDEHIGEHDHCEALSDLMVRAEEGLESAQVAVLPPGTALIVMAQGDGRRLKIAASGGARGSPYAGVSGWVSSRTATEQPLLTRCSPDMVYATADFDVNGRHEVKYPVTMRQLERLDSDVVGELEPGAIVRIKDLGTINRRRVKVCTKDACEGWISAVTRKGEPLLGKITAGSPAASVANSRRSSKAKNSQALLIQAVQERELPAIRKIVESRSSVISKFTMGSRNVDLNLGDVRGKTPLIYASALGHKEVAEYLLLQHADVSCVDDTQKSALHHAARRGAAVEMTRSPSASSSSGSKTPMIVLDVYAEIAGLLLQYGAAIDGHDHNGCTPLMFAAANGRIPVARELLAAQADVNVKDHEGHRPLDYAEHFGHDKVAKLIRDAGGMRGGFFVSAEDSEQSLPAATQSAVWPQMFSPEPRCALPRDLSARNPALRCPLPPSDMSRLNDGDGESSSSEQLLDPLSEGDSEESAESETSKVTKHSLANNLTQGGHKANLAQHTTGGRTEKASPAPPSQGPAQLATMTAEQRTCQRSVSATLTAAGVPTKKVTRRVKLKKAKKNLKQEALSAVACNDGEEDEEEVSDSLQPAAEEEDEGESDCESEPAQASVSDGFRLQTRGGQVIELRSRKGDDQVEAFVYAPGSPTTSVASTSTAAITSASASNQSPGASPPMLPLPPKPGNFSAPSSRLALAAASISPMTEEDSSPASTVYSSPGKAASSTTNPIPITTSAGVPLGSSPSPSLTASHGGTGSGGSSASGGSRRGVDGGSGSGSGGRSNTKQHLAAATAGKAAKPSKVSGPISAGTSQGGQRLRKGSSRVRAVTQKTRPSLQSMLTKEGLSSSKLRISEESRTEGPGHNGVL